MLDLVVEVLPDGLRAVFPCPQVHLHEVHRGLEVEVLEHVGGRNLVEVAIAERGERANPNVLHEFDAIELAEVLERQRQVLQVLVFARDVLAAGCDSVAVVTTLCNAAVAVYVIALVLRLQQLAEFLDLTLHPEQTWCG